MKKCLLTIVVGMLLLVPAYAQERSISGKVTSAEDGAPAPGVSIVVKGTTIGTTSDTDGNFAINVPPGNNTLVFSFIGFKTTEVDITNRTRVDVMMEIDITELTEVVVVGYGTQIKHDVTGNIAQVSGEKIQNLAVTSFEQAMQGRAAGVLVTTQNGKLGQGINVRVRGSSSISAGNEPLYVVDGMIINTDNLSSNDAATNALADLNFNDIASIEVLKDASASALYGSRGANGVVLITTNRGQAGKTKFTANFQYGSSKPTRHREFLNAQQYVELMRESAYNNDLADGYDPINNPADYAGSWLEYIEETMDFLSGGTDWRNHETNTNWEREAFQKANFSSFDLTASGGSEKTTFYFGGGYTDQDGILIGNAFKRLSGRLNIDHQASDKLKFGLNVNIAKSINNRLSTDNAFATPLQLVAQAPITPVRDSEGNLFDDSINPSMFYYPATVERENATFVTSVFRNIVGTNVSYNLTPDLRLIGEYGFDLLTQNEDRYWNELTQSGRGIDGYGQSRWVQVFNSTSRAMLNYYKAINSHQIDVLGGVEFQKKTINTTNIEAQGFPMKELTKIQSATEIVGGLSALEEETFISYFGRANYKFMDRYLVSVSGRVDGSSKFGPDTKYGFFPAASVGWIMTNEGFLSGVGTLSFLKLRASYGLVGNAAIPNYRHFALYDGVGYGFPLSPGITPSQIPNPDLSWEKTAQLDVGLEFAFLNDRLSGEIDYYNKQTEDLLLNTPVPATSGFTTQFRNVGALENKGFELVLNYELVRTNKFSATIGANYARNNNKILRLDGQQERIDPASSRYVNVVMVGQPIGTFFGREYAGVNPANGDALWFLNREPSSDEIADEDAFLISTLFGDRYVTNNFNLANSVVLGNPTPTDIYGLHGNLSYGGLDVSFLFQGVGGNKVFDAAGGFMSANGRYEDNSTVDQLQRWRQPGDITMVPQARLYANNGAQSSSRYLYDGAYLRLKSVTVGYTLPPQFTSKVNLTSVRFYVTGQNLLTITDYPGWDPEVNTDFLASNIFLSNDFYAAPQPKNLIVGIKVGF